MKSTVEVLRDAREFLSDPDNWLRDGHYARAADGTVLGPDDDDMTAAVRCCAIGACYRVDGAADDSNGAVDALYETFRGTHRRGLTLWNDCEATHDELIALFDKAIADQPEVTA